MCSVHVVIESTLLVVSCRALPCVLLLRDYSSDKPVPATQKSPSLQPSLRETVANWDTANKLYYGPDRDMANFPTLVRPAYCPPVRLAFIPDSWFRMFYDKTGVTGVIHYFTS